MIRTRFAPSPTGYMHIGNLRTALFSYLIAKSNKCQFILRIEDTDKKREIVGATNIIYNTLKQSNLLWDEGPDIGGNAGPYIQSQRKEIYLKYAKQLVKQGDAYYCFCPEAKTDLDTYKDECNYSTGVGYNGHCRKLTLEEIEKNLNENKPYVIRQKIPVNKIITYNDQIYGDISFNSSDLDDQVLIKQDGYPTYNFANVIDDHLMNITHVVRGNEYISSTPKYILLYNAFNWDIPNFIHLPLINGKDENGNISKLSKRHGAVSFQELTQEGYLPEAIVNYIAFLGWNSKTDQEFFSLEELTNTFKIQNINKSAALFDYTKLDWYNTHYIQQLTNEQFYHIGILFLKEKATLFNWKLTSQYIKNKITKFSNLYSMINFLIDLQDYNVNLFLHKKNKVEISDVLPCLNYILSNISENYTKNDYEHLLRKYAEINNVKFGHPMWIYRIALSGLENTPLGALEMSEILGYKEITARLNYAIEKINK